MITQPTLTEEHREAHRDHSEWLDDCIRWRSQHRTTLATLARIEAAILEQEAALVSHAAELQSHEMHLQWYKLADFEPGGLDDEQLEWEHDEFQKQHEQTREAHERIREHHVNIGCEVDKLLKLCESGM